MQKRDVVITDDLDYLRKESLRTVLFWMTAALYLWGLILFQPFKLQPVNRVGASAWGPVLLAGGLVVAFAVQRRSSSAAAAAAIAGMAAAILFMMWVTGARVAPYMLVVVVSLTGLLFGMKTVVGATVLCSAAVIAVGSLRWGYVPISTEVLSPLLVIDVVGTLSFLAVRNLYFALQWALDRTVAAQRNEEEARLYRGELARTLKALTEAYQRLEYANYDLARAREAAEKRVMPIFQYRFGHGVQKLRFLLAKGVAGRACLTTVETAWRRRADYYATWHGRWDTEMDDPLVTLAVHAHDVLTYVLGPVRQVLAHAATLVNPIETEDTVSTSLEMADGSLASLSVTTGSSAEITRHRFCFSNLTAESNTQPYQNSAEPWTFTADSPEVEKQIEETLARFTPLPEGFEGQFYRFYQALQEETALPVTLADARASLELITAIYHASQTGRVAELPIGPDHPKYAGWRPQ